jgi:hypothetical protein
MGHRTYFSLSITTARKPEGKRPLGRPRRRWIDNIKMELLEIGVNVVDWIVWLRIGTGGELL